MKKLLLIAGLVAIGSIQSFAQGTFNFNNNGGNAVYFDVIGGTKTDATISFDYAYSTSSGITSDSAFTASTYTVKGATGGLFLGTKQTIAGYVGTVSIEVRGWSTAAGSYAAAVADKNTYYSGTSTIFNMPLADSSQTPVPTPTFLKSYMPSFFVTKGPEPTTIALGVMGLSLLVFRRRK